MIQTVADTHHDIDWTLDKQLDVDLDRYYILAQMNELDYRYREIDENFNKT